MLSTFLDDVLTGLASWPRTLPCKYFYDQAGSRLFDQICDLPEYYLTRSEWALLNANLDEIVASVSGPDRLVELGSGSSVKTRLLLDALPRLRRYVPVDISAAHLLETAHGLRQRYPRLVVEPVVADYAESSWIHGVTAIGGGHRSAVFFPGSSLGNFHPDAAIRLLAEMREVAGRGGVILLGVDPGRDEAAVVRAYNDDAGVTAAFNRNVLVRISCELGGSLDVGSFRHEAVWQRDQRRVEMRLVSTRRQAVTIGSARIELGEGETIVTEHCYKHRREDLARMTRDAGLEIRRTWTDPDAGMELHELVPSG